MDYRQIITIEPGKRSGKPCMFVKSGGVSSFEKVVDAAGRVGLEV